MEKTALTKFTGSKRKVKRLFALEKITPKDLEGFNKNECDYLSVTSTQLLQQLKGEERDSFITKIELVVPADSKNQIWEYNQHLISGAISKLMREYGSMPDKTAIAEETGLSRQTIAKHLKDYKAHPEYAAEMDRFKYFDMVGATNKQRPGTVVTEQKNYIQINNTILSQENLRQLSAEQLNQIENIITRNA